MSDYAQQLDEAINKTLKLWAPVYPTAWPVLDVLAQVSRAFIGEGGSVLAPWFLSMTPEWVEYALDRLAALTPSYYKPEQITDAIKGARTLYPHRIYEYFKDRGNEELMDDCRRTCAAADKYFPEQAAACSIPLVKMEGVA